MSALCTAIHAVHPGAAEYAAVAQIADACARHNCKHVWTQIWLSLYQLARPAGALYQHDNPAVVTAGI